MKRFVIFLFITLCSVPAANAQTYLEHLQQKKQGQASVTVKQSKEIDDLVNGSNTTPQKDEKPLKDTKTYQQKTSEKETQPYPLGTHKTAKDSAKKEQPVLKENADRRDEAARPNVPTTKKNERNEDSEMDIPTVDLRKKVMRKSYKVTGYRVQAYAGGNSRADRQRAEQIGNSIKVKYPDQPVYVHFYSPRWICRVGNYRNYEEAQRMLRQVRAMGYRAATIVKGKITVQY